MNKIITSVIIALSLVLTLSSCAKTKAQQYYDKAQVILNEKYINDFSEEDNREVQALLDKAIEAKKDWFKPYWQKIQLYKLPPTDNIEEILNIYNLWIDNGNTLDEINLLSYGCTHYSNGNKDSAKEIFNSIYYRNQNKLASSKFTKKKDNEPTLVAAILSGMFSGIIKDRSDLEKIALETEAQRIFFYSTLEEIESNGLDEIIKCYAGL